MKRFILSDRSFAKAKLQATGFRLVAVIAITAMAFTACTKKSTRTEGSTQTQTHYTDEHEGGPDDDYEALPQEPAELTGEWHSGNITGS